MKRTLQIRFHQEYIRVSHSAGEGGGGWGAWMGFALHSMIFFRATSHQNHCPLWGNHTWKWPLHLSVKHPSKKWFLEKKPEKSATVINNCVSIMKQHWKMMAEIPQERDFLTWSLQNFVRKVKVCSKLLCYLIDLANKLYHEKNSWFVHEHVVGRYVLVKSCMRFRVNPHSIVAWMSRNSLLEAGAKSEVSSLAKWLSVRLRTKWLWIWVQLQSFKHKVVFIKHFWRKPVF